MGNLVEFRVNFRLKWLKNGRKGLKLKRFGPLRSLKTANGAVWNLKTSIETASVFAVAHALHFIVTPRMATRNPARLEILTPTGKG